LEACTRIDNDRDVVGDEPIQVDGALSGEAIEGGCEVARVARAGIRRWGWVWRWLSALINCRVPIGYEDETGFHYGIQPVPRQSI